MSLPQHVRTIVSAAAKKYPQCCNKATDQAMAQIHKLPDYKDIAEKLLWKAVQSLIYEQRASTVRIEKFGNGTHSIPKVQRCTAGTAVINRKAQQLDNLFNLPAGGTTLGSLTGAELLSLADDEEAKADGHIANALFYRKLAAAVPKDKMVSQSVSMAKLKAIYRSIYSAPAPKASRSKAGKKPSQQTV